MMMDNVNSGKDSAARPNGKNSVESPATLPVLDCHGCGVCCLHMGYPAFNLTKEQLERTAAGSELSHDEISQLGPAAKSDLARWVHMPEPLRQKLLDKILSYQAPPEGELDQACIWLDPSTRLCQHHEHRPQVCRDFEIGCNQCQAWRSVYRDQIEQA